MTVGEVVLFTQFVAMLFHPDRRARRTNQHPIPRYGQW